MNKPTDLQGLVLDPITGISAISAIVSPVTQQGVYCKVKVPILTICSSQEWGMLCIGVRL